VLPIVPAKQLHNQPQTHPRTMGVNETVADAVMCIVCIPFLPFLCVYALCFREPPSREKQERWQAAQRIERELTAAEIAMRSERKLLLLGSDLYFSQDKTFY